MKGFISQEVSCSFSFRLLEAVNQACIWDCKSPCGPINMFVMQHFSLCWTISSKNGTPIAAQCNLVKQNKENQNKWIKMSQFKFCCFMYGWQLPCGTKCVQTGCLDKRPQICLQQDSASRAVVDRKHAKQHKMSSAQVLSKTSGELLFYYGDNTYSYTIYELELKSHVCVFKVLWSLE